MTPSVSTSQTALVDARAALVSGLLLSRRSGKLHARHRQAA
jgi:hypothetical protein